MHDLVPIAQAFIVLITVSIGIAISVFFIAFALFMSFNHLKALLCILAILFLASVGIVCYDYFCPSSQQTCQVEKLGE